MDRHFNVQGHDTTTSLLSWFLYAMAMNPDIQVIFCKLWFLDLNDG